MCLCDIILHYFASRNGKSTTWRTGRVCLLSKKKYAKPVLGALTTASLLLGLATPYGTGIARADGEFDFTKVPKLLITELVPDTANVIGAPSATDAYEFIEIYNNSNVPVTFFDNYSIDYHYLNASKADVDATWGLANSSDNPIIPAKGSIVFWVMNTKNKDLTVEQFNTNYGTSLKEGTDLFRLSGGDGMHNSQPRDLIIKDKSGNVIVSASYQNDDQTQKDKGIFYAYPTDGSTKMTMVTDGEYATGVHAATPGMAESVLVPTQTPDDGNQEPQPQLPQTPVTIAHTPVTDAIDDSNLELMTKISPHGADASKVGATVYYKLNSETEYTTLPMTVDPGHSTADELAFEAAIPKEKLTQSKLQYYIEATDGTGSKDTEVYTVNVRASMNYNYVPALLRHGAESEFGERAADRWRIPGRIRIHRGLQQFEPRD